MRKAIAMALTAAAIAAIPATATAGAHGQTPVLAPYRVCIPRVGCSDPPNTIGFGHAKPATIYLGGDGTGVVCRIHWLSWGHQFAVGTGTAADVAGQPDDAHAKWTDALVVLSHLGRANGQAAYLHFTWTFPDGEVHPESRTCAGF